MGCQRRLRARSTIAGLTISAVTLLAFTLLLLSASEPAAAQAQPACRPGEGWREAFGAARPDLAEQIVAGLRRQGLAARVTATDYGEADSCGSFYRAGAQLLIRLEVAGSEVGPGRESTLEAVRSVVNANPAAGLGGVHVTFSDGVTVPLDKRPTPVGAAAEPAPTPTLPAATYQKKVYVVVYDPLLSNGLLLSDYLGWADHSDMTASTIKLFSDASSGRMQFTVAATSVRTDGWPVLSDGHKYTEQEYLAIYNRQQEPYSAMVDYNAIVNDPALDICGKANRGEIDEVWIYNGPYFGFYESTLVGPGAYWLNSGPVPEPHSCDRLIPLMGPSPERPDMIGHGEGHRMESTMVRVYGGWDMNRVEPQRTSWDQWALDDYQSSAYNYSGCGTIHYPPNGTSDYDYANGRAVQANCADFVNYPNISDPPALQSVTCSAWNCDHYAFMQYWFGHLPPNSGCGDDRDKADWWHYFANPAAANDPTLGCPYPSSVSLAGRVTWGDGAPAESAQVSLTGPSTATKSTGTDGRYTFDNLPAGQYQVTVSHSNSSAKPSQSVALPPPNYDVNFTLPTQQLRIVSATFSPTTIRSGEQIRVEIVVENTGDETAETQGPPPGTVYAEGETDVSKGYPGEVGKWRVGVNWGSSFPYGSYNYRWGLGQSLPPGQRITVVGYIRLNTAVTQDYWTGIVREQLGWWDEGEGRTTITVGGAPPTPSATPGYTPTGTPTPTRTPTPTGTTTPQVDLPGVWRRQTSNTTNWLWPVQWVDQQFARVAGASGKVLGTTNAGINWTTVPATPPTSSNIQDMQFVDRYYGWVAGWGALLKTTDGGTSWQPQSYGGSHNIVGVYFRSRQRGWLVGESWIRRTTDGGATWQGVQMPAPATYLQDVYFIDQNVGWVVGWDGNILKSQDGGASWSRLPSGVSVILEGVHFSDPAHGVVVGHAGTILTTSDGGASWTKRSSGVSTDLFGVEFTDAERGWASGAGGTLLMTSDGGKTWKRETSNVTTTLQKVSALDPNHILVAGEGGVILRRTLDLAIRSRRATHPPLLDGQIDDWSAVSGVYLNKSLAETVEREIPTSTDAQMNLKTSWSPGFLYIAGPVTDDLLVGNDGDPAKPWQSDSIEIGIEYGASSHQFTLAVDGRMTDQGVPVSGIAFYTKTVTGGWNFELAVPASMLGLSEYRAGQSFAFTFGAWDDDERGGTIGQSHLIRRGTSTFASSSSLTGWGTLQLVDEGEPFPESTETPTPTPTVTPSPTSTTTPGATTGVIRGVVWNDLNANAKQEPAEPGLFGVQIRLYRGQVLLGVTVTGANGAYRIPDLPPGAYRIVELNLNGLTSITPDELTVNVDAGYETVVNFGDWSGRRTWLPLLMR